jgi:phage gp36-like protein
MSYIQWSEVVARYRKVAEDYDNPEAQNGFIGGAESEIDARLAHRYTVPFTPVPAAIKDLAIDMAYYRMIWRDDDSKKLKDFIDSRLNAYASGSATLVTSGAALATNAQAWAQYDGIRTVFGPDDPINYSVSSEWQFDTQNERIYD